MLSKKLKKLRTLSQLTQDELANQLEMSRVRYNNYETGRRSPDLQTLHQIADYFGVTTDYLLGRVDHQQNNKVHPLSPLVDEKSIDQELEEIIDHIKSICYELIYKGEALDEITKVALYNSLKNVLEMTDKMRQIKKSI